MASQDDLLINTIRFLAVDMVEEAKSGHPGLPLGAAPMAYVLWDRFLKHNPANPHWPDRDRFVLSAGHGSALLYALLHLTGYDLPIEELRRFRQFGSRTPGHPELGHTPGVEATTGPLGQGLANAVGMTLAQRYLASRYNRPGFKVVDHTTFALCSDGDMMEGIGAEAAAFAGTMKASPLVVLYDDNHISLEGPTSLTFTEDVERRFSAYGWQVAAVEDGNSVDAIEAAVRRAVTHPGAPWLLRIRTHIGYGSPRQDTKEAHGEPLGKEGTRETKRKLGWPLEPSFIVPEEAKSHFRRALGRGRAREEEWRAVFEEYRSAHPALAREFERLLEGGAPPAWDPELPTFASGEPIATRDASASVERTVAEQWPALLGGSADLAPSTKTIVSGLGDFSFEGECGRNLHFGVRENAMVGMLNGLALHGGVRPYGSTFLIFSDYARPAIRLSALMQLGTIVLFTHDSIALGEDGPTHQPVEQLASLRAIPGFTTFRPADANETTGAWRAALARAGPVAIVLTRQKLPVLDPAAFPVREGPRRGAYVLSEAAGGPPEVVLLATGSEVHLVLAAQQRLGERKLRARVVSMPCRELFEEQEAAYREAVLPDGVPRVVVEAASPLGWDKYAGPGGAVIGLARFGASGPGSVVYEKLGFSVDRVVETALRLVRPAAAAG
jgi:transketolase